MEITRDLMLRTALLYLKRASLKKAENLLIIAEPPSDHRVIDAFFEAVGMMGAIPLLAMTPYRGVQNIEPPKPLAAAMKNADVAVTVIPYESADFYTKGALEMLEGGTRMLGCLSATAEMLVDYVYLHDFTVTDGICEILESIMSKAKTVHITSPEGTDIQAEIGGRPVQVNPGLVTKPGDEAYLPAGVVGQAPIEESWNGTIVFEAFAYPVGILRSPITLKIRDGRITEITGGEQAQQFKAWFESRNDPNIYIVCHYGFGINPNLKKLSELKFLNERMMGIFDIGFGTNDLPCFMGKVRANGHTDGLMAKAAVSFDSEYVMKDGKFVHPEIVALMEKSK